MQLLVVGHPEPNRALRPSGWGDQLPQYRKYLGQPSVFGGLHMLRFDSTRRPRFWRLDIGSNANGQAARRPKLPLLSRVKREVKRVLGRKVA